MSQRVASPVIRTYLWRAFNPLLPDPECILIEDIARSLSNLCRYNGHVREFYCPTPEQRVLTADLRWVPAIDLKVGTELLGFDEHPVEIGGAGKMRRRMRPSVVLHAEPVKRQIVRLELKSGETIRSSIEHPWLVATKLSRNQAWRSAGSLAQDLRAGRKRYMHKFIEPWTELTSWDAGWLAGLYDGEGYLSMENCRGSKLGVSQKEGLILSKAVALLHSYNFGSFSYNQTSAPKSGVWTLQTTGGWRAILRLLGSLRPVRLLDKFQRMLRSDSFSKQLDGAGEPLEIVRAYDEGEVWCAGLETSTRTYLCEGFAAHNSVAEHSYWVSLDVPPKDALWGLLHDASEAYLGDMMSPLKYHTALGEQYRQIEAGVMRAVCVRFSLPPTMPPSVARADHAQLQREHDWLRSAQPKRRRNESRAMTNAEAELEFLNRFRELTT